MAANPQICSVVARVVVNVHNVCYVTTLYTILIKIDKWVTKIERYKNELCRQFCSLLFIFVLQFCGF